VIAPIKSEVDDICLYIINFEDLTAPPTPVEEGVADSHKLSKCECWYRLRVRSLGDLTLVVLQ
jgi:hypothetical protein